MDTCLRAVRRKTLGRTLAGTLVGGEAKRCRCGSGFGPSRVIYDAGVRFCHGHDNTVHTLA